MNQYLVAIHYIQLLQAELDILNHDARLLFDLKIEPNLAKRELADLKVSLSKLSDKNLYIEGTIWYQPSLFAIIDQNLGVIDDWLKELDDFFEFTYSTTVFTVLKENQPLVLLYYGPSGVGKTELAKKISSFYDGKLTRIQFSMMQTDEAFKYIFGDTHGKPSLARDLLSRETNVVLIDEFDKVSPSLYNVFYQMFDEGEFEDINYKVDVSNCIFILTSNFNNEKNIAEVLGFPIFSRIDTKIKFKELTKSELSLVIEKIFESIYKKISTEDQKLIDEVELKNKYLESVEIFKNIRLLDKFIENDIFNVLFENRIQGNDS